MLADGKGASGALVKGFDISHHNKDIPWDELIREGNVFVIMKATEGTGFRDKAFLENWKQAGRRGLIRGAYHVMRYGRPNTAKQIQLFEFVLREAEPRGCDLGAVLDLKSAARGKPVPERDVAAVQEWEEWSRRTLRRPVVLFADTFFFENFLPLPEGSAVAQRRVAAGIRLETAISAGRLLNGSLHLAIQRRQGERARRLQRFRHRSGRLYGKCAGFREIAQSGLCRVK